MKNVHTTYGYEYTARGGYQVTITSPFESHLHHVGRQLKAYDQLVDACKRALPLLKKSARPYNQEFTTVQLIRMALAQAGELKETEVAS